MPGPVPKRSDQRRRTNSTGELTMGQARVAKMPAPDESWHPAARDWYVSLGESGQSDYYQASDWSVARLWAEILTRQLESERMNGQMIAAWSAAATTLLSTEGDRRRLRLELERRPVESDERDEVEDELDRHRQRRLSS